MTGDRSGLITRVALPSASAPEPLRSLLAGAEPAATLFNLRATRTRLEELSSRTYPRRALGELLLGQARARAAGAASVAAIQRLANTEAVVVATGQQVGLLGGPLYTLYKALAAASHARALSEAGVPAVALFWMASFDHDFEEVARVRLLAGEHEPRALELPCPAPGAPVGAVRPGAAIHELLDQVRDALAPLPYARETLSELRRCYRPDRSLADAFARWLGSCTDRFGLILLDPADPRFAALARPWIERELLSASDSRVAEARGRALARALGVTPAVPPRPRARLGVFFTDDAGCRAPLLRAGDDFTCPSGHLSRAAAARLLARAPERFTPDALLRPIVQDALLPTLACVLGPGELRYHAQLGPLYRWAGVPQPEPLLRPRLTLIPRELVNEIGDAPTAETLRHLQSPGRERWIARRGLERPQQRALTCVDQLRAGARQLHARLDARDFDGAEAIIATLRQAIEDASAEDFTSSLAALAELERELTRARLVRGYTPRRAALRTIVRAYTELERKLTKHGRRNQRSTLRRIRAALPPPGGPQERAMTIAQLLAWRGPDVLESLARVCAPPRQQPTHHFAVLETSCPGPPQFEAATEAATASPPMGTAHTAAEPALPASRLPDALRTLRRLRLGLARRYRKRLQVSLRSSGSRPLPTDRDPLPIALLAMGGVGGSGRVARAVACGLADRGHEVHLFSSDNPHWNDSQLDWVTTHRIGLQQTPQPPERVDETAAARLASALDRHCIRVVNVHYASGLLGVALAARERLGRRGEDIRVCASLHGTDVTSWTASPASADAVRSRRVLAEQLARCDAITTVSRWLAARARATFELAREPLVIPNAVEARLFHPRPGRALRERLADEGELLIAHVSNLRPVKRSLDAIELLGRARAAGVPARMLLMGDGPQADALRRRAAALELTPYLHMTGALQPGPLARHLAACDLAVVSSESESFSLAALEAMACGLPVLGTRCGGLEEVVALLEGYPTASSPTSSATSSATSAATSSSAAGPLSRLLVKVGDTEAMCARLLELLASDARLRETVERLMPASMGPFREHKQILRYLAAYRGMLADEGAPARGDTIAVERDTLGAALP